MYSKAILVAFLSVVLSGFTASAAPAKNNNAAQCSAVTSTVTVTVPAAAATGTGKTLINTGGNQGGAQGANNAATNGAAGNNNKGGKGAQGGNAAGAKGGNNAANNGKGAAGNNAGKGAAGNNAGNGAAAGNNGKGGNGAAAGDATGAAGNGTDTTGAGGAGGDPQTSLTLDPSVIAKGFANDGQDVPADGQVASLTSTNNFINFCATVPQLPITNGQQIKTGSCNPAPMGVIAATTNMPSSKFQFPQNFGTVKANTAFTIKMAISHLETGFFTNANENYFAAPQQVNDAGDIKGHSHVVIEQLTSLTQTEPNDPNKFAFFKGLNDKAQGGVLTADVTNGLPVGVYKLSSINSAANHQPALVAVAQHGSLDDVIYFTVTEDGQADGAAAGAAGNATAAAGADQTGAAAGGNNAGKGGAGGNNNGKGAAAGANNNGKGAAAAGAGANNAGKGGAAAGANNAGKGGAAANGNGKRWFW